MKLQEHPIGVFDSGLGGLTVVRALRERLPWERIVYLGDTARLPYGSKSPETVIRYARSCARFLSERGIKFLLVACNTASAYALSVLREETEVPVIGVIEPGVRASHTLSRSGHLGVIGTRGTIGSGAYAKELKMLNPKVVVTGLACPLLVPLAEEGLVEGEIAEAVVSKYLSELASRDREIDTLILGCTHYPLLRSLIQRVAEKVFAHEMILVDSASATARVARKILEENDLLGGSTRKVGLLTCYVTDDSRMQELAPRFLGEKLPSYKVVDI